MPWKQNDETGEMYWVDEEFTPSNDYTFTKPDYSLGGGAGSSYGGININDVTYTPSGGISVKGGGEGLDVNDYTYKPGVGIVYTGGGGTGSGMSFSGVDAGGSPTSVRAPESSLGGLGGLLKSFGNIVSGKQKIGGDNGVGLDQLMSLFLMAKVLGGGKGFMQPQVAGYKGSIPNLTATRTAIAQPAYVPYSGKAVMGGKQLSDVTYAAEGGIMGLARGGAAKPPRYLDGPTDGMADKINTDIDGQQPAKLSHGEFVIPADVVSHLGNGNSKAGANVLYKMMDRVRKARTGTKKQGKQINPAKFMPGGIAGYAGGGAVAFEGGGGVPAGTSTTSNLSEWAGPYVTGMLGQAQALANQPYQAYEGPLTAGYSPLQQQAFTGYQNLQAPGAIGQAAQTAGGIAGQMQGLQYSPTQFGNQFQGPGAYQGVDFSAGLTPQAYQAGQFANQFDRPKDYQTGQFDTGLGPVGSVQSYMSPYLQNVVDVQAKEARRQAAITGAAQQAQLAQAGAFGGSRDAIMRAELGRNLNTQIGGITATGLQTAYDKALAQRLAESQASMEAQKAGEASRQFGAGQGMTGAQLAAQYGLAGQQLGEQSRQFGATQGMQGLQMMLDARRAQEASKQFGAGQAMTAAQLGAQYGLAGQQAAEQSKQFGSRFGLEGLQSALQAAQAQGNLGVQQGQLGLQGLAAQLGAGEQQRAIEQQGISARQAEFEKQRLYPYQQLQFQQSMLQGLPVSTYSNTPNTSSFQDLQNIIAQLQGLGKAAGG